jgi:hypothetical protein
VRRLEAPGAAVQLGDALSLESVSRCDEEVRRLESAGGERASGQVRSLQLEMPVSREVAVSLAHICLSHGCLASTHLPLSLPQPHTWPRVSGMLRDLARCRQTYTSHTYIYCRHTRCIIAQVEEKRR